MKPSTKSLTARRLAGSVTVIGLPKLSCMGPFCLDASLLVAVLLREPAIAVGRGAGVDQVHVRDLVQVLTQRRHRAVDLAQVARLLRLGVGLVGDADVQVEGRLAEL